MKKISLIFYLNRMKVIGFIVGLIIIGISLLVMLNYEYKITEVNIEAIGYDANYTIRDNDFLESLQTVIDDEELASKNKVKIEGAKFKLIVKRRIGSENYFLNNSTQIFNQNTAIKLPVQLDTELKQWIIALEEISPYGELISYEKANEIFPKDAKATVKDLETGLIFQVQRRAGSKHADVQPLTKEDTAIFKEIYGGNWSWKRRAVVVEIDEKKLAGSMNGMPHGNGAITDNNFPGHFCIHFFGSRVHGNNEENLAHQIMVWKSAGRFGEFIDSQLPEEFPELLFTILDQRDEGLLKEVLFGDKSKPKEELIKKLSVRNISRAKLEKVESAKNGESGKIFAGQAKFKYIDEEEKIYNFKFSLAQDKDNVGWRVEAKSVEVNVERGD